MATRNNTLLIKRSNVPGKVPTSLKIGELALNTADVKLYASGTTENQILQIGWDRLPFITGTTAEPSPTSGDKFIIWDASSDTHKNIDWDDLPGAGGGETNTASNLGVGQGVFSGKSGTDLQFYSLSGGTNATLTLNGDTIVIDTVDTDTDTNDYLTGGTLNSNSIEFNRTDELNVLTLSGGTNVTITEPTTGIFKIDTAGSVDVNGTPSNNQLAVWTDSDTIEGDGKLTWDTTTLAITGQVVSKLPDTVNVIGGTGATVDWNDGMGQILDLNASTGTTAVTLNNPNAGGTYFLKILQVYSPTTKTPQNIIWPGTVKWPGGTAPTITAVTGATDTVVFFYDGTSYYGNFAQNYS